MLHIKLENKDIYSLIVLGKNIYTYKVNHKEIKC